jgi:hypothetical protein
VGSIPITRSIFPPARRRSRPQTQPPAVQQLYLARDRIEAQLLKDHLDRHLVRAVVLGDFLAGAAGELPAGISPSLWLIDDEDLVRARALLADFLAPPAPPTDRSPWICAACGEPVEPDFDLCWNCCRPREC